MRAVFRLELTLPAVSDHGPFCRPGRAHMKVLTSRGQERLYSRLRISSWSVSGWGGTTVSVILRGTTLGADALPACDLALESLGGGEPR